MDGQMDRWMLTDGVSERDRQARLGPVTEMIRAVKCIIGLMKSVESELRIKTAILNFLLLESET